MMIDLQETESEFVLFIPPSQKERAKGIEGRKWDSDRKCWVYPRTGRIFDALIAEFGDDLSAIKIKRPVPKQIKETPEDNKLQEKISELLTTLKSNRIQSSDTIETLRNTIITLNNELGQKQQILISKDTQIQALKRKLTEVQAESERLNRSTSSSQKSISDDDILKQIAVQATGNDPKFAKLMSKTKLDDMLPNQLTKEIEKDLRKLLGEEDPSSSLFDLLSQAKDSEKLQQDAIELAHIIRKQRNTIIHSEVYQPTYKARILLCLFAASLLWPELPE